MTFQIETIKQMRAREDDRMDMARSRSVDRQLMIRAISDALASYTITGGLDDFPRDAQRRVQQRHLLHRHARLEGIERLVETHADELFAQEQLEFLLARQIQRLGQHAGANASQVPSRAVQQQRAKRAF